MEVVSHDVFAGHHSVKLTLLRQARQILRSRRGLSEPHVSHTCRLRKYIGGLS